MSPHPVAATSTAAGAQSVLVLLIYLIVVLALGISASSTLRQMVSLYRLQASLLTVVVVVQGLGEPILLVLAPVPATLAVIAPPLLARASLAAPSSRDGRSLPARPMALVRVTRASLNASRLQAESIWLRHGASRLRGAVAAGVDVAILATAVLVAGRFPTATPSGSVVTGHQAYVTVALALVAQGLFTMINKRDVIAQIVGLLVIDHGLLTAAVLLAPSQLAPTFVLALLFYVLVTLTILVWILPALNRSSQSIEVGDNTLLRG